MAAILSEDEIRQITFKGANLVPRQVGSETTLHQQVTRLIDLFNQLFSTLRADTTLQHRTLACNLLSSLIEKCAQSTERAFQLLLWQRTNFWRQAFDIYLSQHHSLNVKPLRLLLTSLTSVLAKCQHESVCEPEKIKLLELLVRYISVPSENAPTRPALQTLAHWLSKKVVSVQDLCNILTSLSQHDHAPQNSSVRGLIDIVLRLTPYDDFASSAGSLSALVLRNVPATSANSSKLVFKSPHESLWVSTVLQILKQKPQTLVNLRNFVFPDIFQQDKASFITLLEDLGVHSLLGKDDQAQSASSLPRPQSEEVLFCVLSVGSRIGLVKVADHKQSPDSKGLFIEGNVLYIPDVLLGDLISSTSDAIRISVLAMLTTSTTTTQLLSTGAMDALKKGLPLLHADSDAGFRSELFTLIKNLVARIKGATANIVKPQNKTKRSDAEVADPVRSSEHVRTHQSFMEWYISFLKAELRPTASYQRHTSALRCISIIAKSGVDPRVPDRLHFKSADLVVIWPFQLNVIDEDMTDLLIDLLLNPYDDVRSAAAEILSLVVDDAQQQDGPSGPPMLIGVLAQAENMMKLSGRADHADGVAHLYSTLFSQRPKLIDDSGRWWTSRCGILGHLVENIEQTVQIATIDMGQAVSQYPLHGLFTSLRYITEKPDFYKAISSNSAALTHLADIYDRLYIIFVDVWKCVHDTLCNDTPAGLGSDELDGEGVETKDVLSYSWRALKESSLLLRTIVKSCPFTISDHSLLSPQQLRQLGDLTFTELAELRHRGAFSTVAQTFVVCCTRSNSGPDPVSETLNDWYKRAILCIQNQTVINTRRSAGLPSLMIGIIVADNKSVLFDKAMQDLTAEATRPVDQAAESAGGLSQVHALNCIKDIIKNSKLGERSESHVPEALNLGAKCLASDTWAVRNSGLMLFRALMDRLIGTNDAFTEDDTYTQSRLSDEAITSLMQVVIGLLGPDDGDVNQVNAEVVFPALQLLQRIQPPRSLLEGLQHRVLKLASNRQWHVRDKAAKTYSVLVPAKERGTHAAVLIRKNARTQNEAHGFLLGARYLIERQGKSMINEDMDTIINAIQSRMDNLLYDNPCPFTQAAFVDVQTSFFYAAIQKQRYLFVPGIQWATVEDMNLILNLPREHFAACSSLRQSLALSLIHEYAIFSGPSNESTQADLQARISTFTQLAARDPDACTTALTEAARLCRIDSTYASQTMQLLAEVSISLLHNSDIIDMEVQNAAQEVLTTLFTSNKADVVQKIITQDTRKAYLPFDARTPLFSDKRLVLQGALLSIRAEDETLQTKELADAFSRWVLQVSNALQEMNPFDTRYAAAAAASQLSIKALTYFSSSTAADPFLNFCLAVYDLNNDDDDEIRVLAAPVATNILNTGTHQKHTDVVPIAASRNVADYISSNLGTSQLAAFTAIARITDKAVSASLPESVRESLLEKSKSDSSLFAHEKQNLFVDETREAKLWSSVAAQLHPTAFSLRLLMNLCTWVIDGLDVFVAEIEAKPDMPLGWSRKSKVFVLGMQVLYAADLVLKLSQRGVEMPVEETAVRTRIERFLGSGEKSGVHVLWLDASREILRE